MNIKELRRVNAQIGRWLKWECDSLTLFHAYAQQFGCGAGANVYMFVLREALKSRGMTLERFREQVRAAK
jgi:hypothetical protein